MHEVEIEPFFLSKYELTNAQWRRMSGTSPLDALPRATHRWFGRKFRGSMPRTELDPIEGVSWDDLRLHLWRRGLTLPTEPEWEYACRAGTTAPWWSGGVRASVDGAANVSDGTAARYVTTSAERLFDHALFDGFVESAPVGSFAPNPFGLHDVMGNVAECCIDKYDFYLFQMQRFAVGEGHPNHARAIEEERPRIVRGGSYRTTAASCRSAARDLLAAHVAGIGVGVRPARPLLSTSDGPR